MLFINACLLALSTAMVSISPSEAALSATVDAFHKGRSCPAPREANSNVAPNKAAALAAVPSLGAGPGQQPGCTGDRFSEVKAGVRIPCLCPPSQEVFAEQFVLDFGADIKTDGSVASQQSNLRNAIVTLQNSFCCPAAAVTFNAQLESLAKGGAAPPPPPPAKAAPPPPPAANQSKAGQSIADRFRAGNSCPPPLPPAANPAPNMVAAFDAAPSLGAGPGSPPPCSGDRFSEVNPAVRIPCRCPPTQDDFSQQFVIDHGSEIKTDGSVASQQSNLRKAIVTLQNSFCCPAVSVTFNAQLKDLDSGKGAAKPAAAAPAPAANVAPPKNNNNNNNNNTSKNNQSIADRFRAGNSCPSALPPAAQGPANRAAALAAAPSLGAGPGQNPPCSGDRFSEINPAVRIPCRCPPTQKDFNEQFVIDHGSEIKTDGSKNSKRSNLEKAIVTLQRSFCCPAVSVNFSAQLKALD
ncbi:hypothetical protein HDU97_001713 [Phlyctochytrium planicorne]|nr:hypothetical protein HDU97_001713 [Phlyctochytrium planicorne]